jgi:phi13 family phage major tail protein
MATKIGCDNLVYAIMTGEETPEKAPTYSEVIKAPGVMSVNINPNSSSETLFADDGPMEVASTLGKVDVEIQKNELTAKNKADLLGHDVDTNGALVYGDSDVAPWVAIAFRTLKSNGKYRYIWLYKGKFSEPEDNNETKGDSINFQSDTITGQFARLNHEFDVNGKKKRPWKYELDADADNANEAAIAGWFKAPIMPGSTVTP